jgi:hypothetical protein
MMRSKLFSVILIILTLSGCFSHTVRKINPQDILQVDLTDFPDGWEIRIEESMNKDWGTQNGFYFGYRTAHSVGMLAQVYFFVYDTSADASDAYNRYIPRFLHERAVLVPTKPTPNINNTTTYMTFCQESTRGFDMLCGYWSQYDTCLVYFGSQFLEPYMVLPDFERIVEDVIDARMINIDLCYSNGR